ncbi:hypothetical protein H9L12_07610 [Sphingomonas rhizophila]|uniref:Terminase small subunit n=1 Tax=Sphingomonas rhizophila TaxID=2071607 RepID=A0A7G9S8R0_9SPHN|nr:hypothetical protein [Sphingomonas rhizophila]QNN64235.1 hypothetical protein H9L12_07610 [Sphingomonas rhizophila]
MPCKNRLLQRSRPPNRKLFDARAKGRFLDMFAATANARMAAESAGVAYQTVFKHRARDAGFAAAWDEALAQGYARLEAELLAAALAPPTTLEGGETSFDFAQDERAGDGQDGRDMDGQALPSTARAVEPSRSREGREMATIEQKLAILREYRRGFGPGRRAAPAVRLASDEEVAAALVKRLKSFALRNFGQSGTLAEAITIEE